uniref:HIT domain-containing protein n=1 Tax=Nothobranchius korthausae TaxID=1143690 RepID=A0A1A8FRH9_9TELE
MWLKAHVAASLIAVCVYYLTVQRTEVEEDSMSSALARHVIWKSEGLVAYLNPRPWTPGSVILESSSPGSPGGSIFHLNESEYLSWLLGSRAVAELLCDRLGVQRCALVSRPHRDIPAQIRIVPLHGLDAEWRPHLAGDEEHNAHDPGYCTSKTAPRWSDSSLTDIQTKIRTKLLVPNAPPDLSFLGDDPAHPGLFSRIIRGEEQHWRVWEDKDHVAFLTPFPNSPGFTVLVPRRPLTSDIFRLGKTDFEGLVLATKKVAQLLEEGLGAWGVGLIFEGFEIDYAHAKLIPLTLPLSAEENNVTKPTSAQFHPTYPGYVTSEDGPEASSDNLEKIHAKITENVKL